MSVNKIQTTLETDKSRRSFLKTTALGSGGFLIGVSFPPILSAVASEENSSHAFNAFVKIQTDNTVTVIIKHLDKGQGVTTGLTTIVAEEMDAAWGQMRWEFAPADASLYNNLFWGPTQGTGGSSSIRNSWTQLREAGALARAMLVQAAAEQWQVSPDMITVKGGMLSTSDNRSASFGELATAAANVTIESVPTLKDPKDFTIIGSRIPRIDSKEKSTGKAQYTIDLQLPGMLNAAVIHPPRFGQRMKSFDASKAKEVDGVLDVVAVPSGIAVIAESFWSALKAKRLVDVIWDATSGSSLGSAEISAVLQSKIDKDGAVAKQRGDVQPAFKDAAKIVEADFEFPFLAHASMEPLNAVVQIGEGVCDIWTGCQSQTRDQRSAASILGLSPAKVTIHTMLAGGSFGRRAAPDSDFVSEAVHIAKAFGKKVPIKVQWTREDDMQGGRYRPVSMHRMKAALDSNGKITAWHHRVVGESFLKGSAFESMIRDGVDGTLVEGARGLPYAVPNLLVDTHMVETGVPTLWWRSVGHTHNGYATEVFLDQIARTANRDPVELRRALLQGHPRHLGVLNLAVQKAGKPPQGDNRGRGVAVHESFKSFVAQVVDVTLQKDGRFTVDKVVAAVDCGIAINPDIITAQIEGGIGYGLSALLRETVSLKEGQVEQSNFDAYQPLRISEMPDITVHIVASQEPPSGVGEPGLPPLAPAVANALSSIGGDKVEQAIRKLPFDRVG